MSSKLNRRQQVIRRHKRVRKSVTGTAERPRLAVYRSGKNIYAQLIDDVSSHTLASASTLDKQLKTDLKSGANVEAAQAVGAMIAQRAKEKGVETIVFDRGGNLYHGRIKALADAAREEGLVF